MLVPSVVGIVIQVWKVQLALRVAARDRSAAAASKSTPAVDTLNLWDISSHTGTSSSSCRYSFVLAFMFTFVRVRVLYSDSF